MVAASFHRIHKLGSKILGGVILTAWCISSIHVMTGGKSVLVLGHLAAVGGPVVQPQGPGGKASQLAEVGSHPTSLSPNCFHLYCRVAPPSERGSSRDIPISHTTWWSISGLVCLARSEDSRDRTLRFCRTPPKASSTLVTNDWDEGHAHAIIPWPTDIGAPNESAQGHASHQSPKQGRHYCLLKSSCRLDVRTGTATSCVIVHYHPEMEDLPDSMRRRLWWQGGDDADRVGQCAHH